MVECTINHAVMRSPCSDYSYGISIRDRWYILSRAPLTQLQSLGSGVVEPWPANILRRGCFPVIRTGDLEEPTRENFNRDSPLDGHWVVQRVGLLHGRSAKPARAVPKRLALRHSYTCLSNDTASASAQLQDFHTSLRPWDHGTSHFCGHGLMQHM